MNRSLITSSVTMAQLQKGIDLVANNLSNVSTTGYKSRDASFSNLLVQSLENQPDKTKSLGRVTPLGIRMGTGARVSDTSLNMAQGTIKQTDRPLDLALTKANRFFTVQVVGAEGNAETRYTRNGTFYLQPDPQNNNIMNLVTSDGYFVLDNSGNRIQLPSSFKALHINQTGQISLEFANGVTRDEVQLGVVEAKRPQLFIAMGDNTFSLPNLSALGLTTGNVLSTVTGGDRGIQQGALESSNVDMTKQMTDLMTLERAYQFNARAVSITNDMMGLVNSLR